MKLVMIKIIFEVLLVPNKRVFRIQVNYVIVQTQGGGILVMRPKIPKLLLFNGISLHTQWAYDFLIALFVRKKPPKSNKKLRMKPSVCMCVYVKW